MSAPGEPAAGATVAAYAPHQLGAYNRGFEHAVHSGDQRACPYAVPWAIRAWRHGAADGAALLARNSRLDELPESESRA